MFKGSHFTRRASPSAVAARWARLNLPSNSWVEVSSSSLERDDQETLWDLYSLSYGNIGLHIRSMAELLSKYGVFRLIDVDDDVEADAFIAYKKTPAGNKIALGGTDGTRAAKSALIREMGRLVKQPGWFGEASHRVAEIFEKAGSSRILDEAVVRKALGAKDITWLGDGYYTRSLGDLGSVKKALYGQPKV